LNVHRVSNVREIEIHTAEPVVPDPSRFEVEIAIAKLKRYKSLSSDQIPAELFETGSKILRCKIYKLINSIWNKEELPDQWKESIIVPVHKKDDKTDCSNYENESNENRKFIFKFNLLNESGTQLYHFST
jgi:hypothetical protein